MFTCGGESLHGAVGAFGTGQRFTLRTLSGTDVSSWAGQRADGAGTYRLAVEPRRTGITPCLA